MSGRGLVRRPISPRAASRPRLVALASALTSLREAVSPARTRRSSSAEAPAQCVVDALGARAGGRLRWCTASGRTRAAHRHGAHVAGPRARDPGPRAPGARMPGSSDGAPRPCGRAHDRANVRARGRAARHSVHRRSDGKSPHTAWRGLFGSDRRHGSHVKTGGTPTPAGINRLSHNSLRQG